MPRKACEGAAGLEMTALLSLEMEDFAGRPLRFSVGQCEPAGQRVCRRIRCGLISPGPGYRRERVARPVLVTTCLTCGHVRWASTTVPRLGEHCGSDSTAQGEGRGENCAHRADTNGPGRPSPAVIARRPAAVP